MKIALFGAKGTIGQRILKEAVERGHEVTVIVRDPATYEGTEKVAAGDATTAESVAAAVAGQEVVISAIGPGLGGNLNVLTAAATSLTDGLKQAGVSRLLIVGGAGSLEIAPGVRLIDTPAFPEAWKPIAQAHADALDIYRTADLDWTYFSPAALIEPGERTGSFRLGTDQLLTDEQGQSRISAEDFAIALLNQVEKPEYIRQRITIAY